MAQEATEVGVMRVSTSGGWPKPCALSARIFRAQRRAHALVGIDAQPPVVARRIDGELLLRAVTRPVALE